MLTVSEKFFSIQGEGASVGVPAYFIRLKSCNLMCGGIGGSHVRTGTAKWWCDTEAVWKQGVETPFTKIVDDWKAEGIFDRILNHNIHVIWTGGEPTMPRSSSEIRAFTQWFVAEYGIKPYYEIETNGTILPVFADGTSLFDMMDQINCSPKLQNSGMKANLRIKPDVIRNIMARPNSWLKFVVSVEDDIREFERDFLSIDGVTKDKICIMPGVDCLANLPERTEFLFEMTKKYGYRGITRQHVLAWDKTTGV